MKGVCQTSSPLHKPMQVVSSSQDRMVFSSDHWDHWRPHYCARHEAPLSPVAPTFPRFKQYKHSLWIPINPDDVFCRHTFPIRSFFFLVCGCDPKRGVLPCRAKCFVEVRILHERRDMKGMVLLQSMVQVRGLTNTGVAASGLGWSGSRPRHGESTFTLSLRRYPCLDSGSDP